MQIHKKYLARDATRIFELEEPWKSRFLNFAARCKAEDKPDLNKMIVWFEKDTAFHRMLMALLNAWTGYRRQVDKRKKE